MNKKNQKVKINKNLVFVLSGALILSVGICLGMIGISAVKADVPFWDKVAQVTGIELADRVPVPEAPSEDITVGAFPGPDVYEKMFFHDGMVKNASFYAPLNWSAGTTTPAGGETTVVTIAKMTNDTGKNLLCRDVFLDLSTARGIWGGDLAVGTTTATGDVSLTVTTTVSLIASNSVTTSSVDILNKEDDEGTDANVYWEFDANEIIAVSDTFDTANATSPDSFLTSGGFTGVGAVSAECWYR